MLARPGTLLRISLLIALLIGLAAPAFAVTYRVVDLLDGESRPDKPCCQPFVLFGPPTITGNKVVFLTRGDNAHPIDALWSVEIDTRRIRKLAGTRTPVPGGVGNFTCLCLFTAYDQAFPVGAGGRVVFYGQDGDGKTGIYTVPAGGGTIARIANLRVSGADGTRFTYFSSATLNGTDVAFYGLTAANLNGAIFRSTVAGTNRRVVITGSTHLDARGPSGPVPDYYGNYGSPSFGATDPTFTATGLFDPSTSANAIVVADDGFRQIADNLTPLAGNPVAERHSVVIYRVSAAADSERVAFYGLGDRGYRGIFLAQGRNASKRFVSSTSRVPGLSVRFQEFGALSYDASGLAFLGSYQSHDGQPRGGIYATPAPGEPISLVASGQRYYKPTIGQRAIDAGRITFFEDGAGADKVWLATPQP